jgi:hypothetical protein
VAADRHVVGDAAEELDGHVDVVDHRPALRRGQRLRTGRRAIEADQ